MQIVAGGRASFGGPYLLKFKLSFRSENRHSEIQTRTVRRGQRARKHFELQLVAGGRAPFAGPSLLNFELVFRSET